MLKSLFPACAAYIASASSSDYVDLCAYDKSFCGSEFKSYSGYVNVTDKSSMFYWYFTPNGAVESDAPFVMWLQGGPGSSSMMGALFEVSPVTLNAAPRLVLREDWKYSWASKMNIVFIDNPVGTGWSQVTDDSAYATSEQDVARDMATFLTRFAELHKETASKRLIITGESYGGHYIPAIAAHIAKGTTPYKLDGIAIGDGLTEPATQVLTKPQAAFDFGLIDEQQLTTATSLAQKAHDLAMAGDYKGALKNRNAMEEGVGKASAVNLYDVRTTKDYSWMKDRMSKLFGLDAVKDMLHVPAGYTFGKTSDKVGQHLEGDIMQSQKVHVEELLNASFRVLLYQGQFDWKDGASSNEAWIRTMQWPGAAGYLTAPRSIWHRSEDNEIAGYWRKYKNLEQVVVLGAGHLVPMNAAKSAFDMISKFAFPKGDDNTVSLVV